MFSFQVAIAMFAYMTTDISKVEMKSRHEIYAEGIHYFYALFQAVWNPLMYINLSLSLIFAIPFCSFLFIFLSVMIV